MGAKMGRFDKVACLRFDERTEKADLRLWEYNPSSSVGRVMSRHGAARGESGRGRTWLRLGPHAAALGSVSTRSLLWLRSP
jgi:hypothetical protein